MTQCVTPAPAVEGTGIKTAERARCVGGAKAGVRAAGGTSRHAMAREHPGSVGPAEARWRVEEPPQRCRFLCAVGEVLAASAADSSWGDYQYLATGQFGHTEEFAIVGGDDVTMCVNAPVRLGVQSN